MQNFFYCLLCFFIVGNVLAQETISGKITDSVSQKPLPYATVTISDSIGTLTNIDGTFSIQNPNNSSNFLISYIGYLPKIVQVEKGKNNYFIGLAPFSENLEIVNLYNGENPANAIIREAIAHRKTNNPENVLQNYQYHSYTKFIIDDERGNLNTQTDSSNLEISTILNEGRAYLSEKVSLHTFQSPSAVREDIEGIKTSGFERPVYEVLSLKVQPLTLYREKYQIFETEYSAPLSHEAFDDYTFKILDTVSTEGRPAYMVYFKPKRERAVAGLEGILYLDTVSYAIQKAKAQLKGEVNLAIDHYYNYYPQENIWFPKEQTITLRAGTGNKDISVFGGSISLGTVQQSKSILNGVINSGPVQENLFLTSSTLNYDIIFNGDISFKNRKTDVYVENDADEKNLNFWEANRKIPFTIDDEITANKVDSIIKVRNIERKIEVKNAISHGYYPVGFFDFDLSKIIKYDNYEGLRLGVGGTTNEKFSRRFNLNGSLAYGFKDETFKYGIGAGYLLIPRSSTWFSLSYNDDIRELGSINFLQGVNDFSIFEPRSVNVVSYYNFKTIGGSLKGRITPKLNAELALDKSDISQLTDYAFFNNGNLYRDYEIAEVKLGFLWRPFSKFLNTPRSHEILDKGYPQFTGQISQSFDNILGGDFNFTKFSLKTEYEINRIDLSTTQFTLEGNYATGDIPLTHAFNSYPNQPNKLEVLNRWSVAGNLVFETMYFNEFFSDRQLALHIKHYFRPFKITPAITPQLVLISRQVVGDFRDISAHQNIEFKTLDKIYTEAGFELNKIYAGFGLSFAYRYGAYHLPTFKENFSFKFTFDLKI